MSGYLPPLRAWALPLVGLLLACSSEGSAPAPAPCAEECEDRVAVRALREMTKLAYNLLLQGNPVGEQSELAPCPLGGTVSISGNASSNASQGTTEVDLSYAFSACHYLQIAGDPEGTYDMTLSGTLAQVGTLAAVPSSTTALVMTSDAMTLDGTVHDPPLDYQTDACAVSLAQNGNRLSGLLCGREVGLDLSGLED